MSVGPCRRHRSGRDERRHGLRRSTRERRVAQAECPSARAAGTGAGEMSDVPSTVTAALEVSSWSDALAAGAAAPVAPGESEVGPADLACFIYTAGTTGPSKGCMLPHRYVVALGEQIARAWGRTSDDVVLTPLPLFHFN